MDAGKVAAPLGALHITCAAELDSLFPGQAVTACKQLNSCSNSLPGPFQSLVFQAMHLGERTLLLETSSEEEAECKLTQPPKSIPM